MGALFGAFALSADPRWRRSRADYATPGSESKAAVDLLAERFPGAAGPDSIDVVWEARGGALAPDVRTRMDASSADAAALEGVGRPVPAARAEVSGATGTIAVARLPLTRLARRGPASRPATG